MQTVGILSVMFGGLNACFCCRVVLKSLLVLVLSALLKCLAVFDLLMHKCISKHPKDTFMITHLYSYV